MIENETDMKHNHRSAMQPFKCLEAQPAIKTGTSTQYCATQDVVFS